MTLLLVFITILLILSISLLFDLASKKERWSIQSASLFECGFSSYFYSRFSFSIHYFMVALIFLFLDLELCVIMPFLMGMASSSFTPLLVFSFILLLLVGLMEEWREGQLEWLN